MFVVNVRELPIRFPYLSGQYFSTSDWHDQVFAVVGVAYQGLVFLAL
jgi:hypothetical protein